MTVIIVTGTPGTGKTTAAKKIAKQKNLKYIDVNKLIEEKKLFESIDLDRGSKIVDTDKLNKVLIDIIKDNKGVVIDSHLSHYLPKKYVDKCIVTKCSLEELKKRLQKRGYKEVKIRENLDAEIFDVCRIEALEAGHNVEVIYT
ncbi:MAG: AAA family ATPase [Nanoarchaeota archaeon]